MRRQVAVVVFFAVCAALGFTQESYSGPRPPKKDLPYLLEASKLIPAEVVSKTGSEADRQSVFSVPGTTSPAKTPLPEPIFLFSPDQLHADQFLLRKLESKDGHRELTLRSKAADDQDLRLTVRKLAPDLYRIEADEMLEPGQYALVPQGGSVIFCFDVY
jgi:hypothetical protein